MKPSDVIALCALALGVFNFWFGILRPWWRGRYATPNARLETLHFNVGDQRDAPKKDERVVLTNLGPAEMGHVRVEMNDGKGKDCLEGFQRPPAPTLPIPVIYPSQTVHFGSRRALGQDPPAVIVVFWRDGRQREQRREIWLSEHHVT